MNNLFRIHLLVYLLLAGILSTQTSCSSTKRQQISAASEEAFNDFKNYISSVENAVQDEVHDAADKWRETTATIESTYKEKEDRLEQYASSWNEERKAEITELKSRFKNYWEKREADYQARMAAKSQASATSSNGGVAADFRTTEIDQMTAADMRPAFEEFVNRIQANKDSYTREDWLTIGTYYEALNARKNELEDQLTDKDKYEIAKAKAKYAAIKGSSVAEPYINEAASDVKDATKTGAKKIGNTAEKVGSEVKSSTKKTVKKIDKKLD